MKKSLIALAVLAASGASFAQSSVTLYGVADIFLGSVKAGGTTTTVLNSGGVAGSRYGFKGTEDLGGGLKANFLLENGFDIDTGAGTAGQAFSRQSYVGFSGGFGEARLGKTWTPYDDISGASNAAFDSALSPNAGIWKSNKTYNANPSNGFYYATPAMGGFSGALSHSLNEKAVGGLQSTAFNVVYAGGPLMVGLAYQVDKTYQATTENKFTRLNGSYDLGVVKLLANYGRADAKTERSPAVMDTTVTPAVVVVPAVNEQVRTNEWQIGVDYPVSSALTLSGGYARSKDDATVGYPAATRKGFGLAAAYSLSKRTTVYGGLRADRTDNDSAADVNVYAVGIKHTF